MTAYTISSSEELLEYTMAIARAKASGPLDQETFDSIIACTRHFMAEDTLPLGIALSLTDFFLFYSNRAMSAEISKYCCENAERSGNESFLELFRIVYAVLISDMSDQMAMVKALYQIKAPFYHKVYYAGEPELTRIIKTLPLTGIEDAIDLGCGFGRVGRILREFGYGGRLTGVDLAQGMLERTWETGAYTEVIQGEILQSLQEFHNKFDLILMIWVSAHCSRQQVAEIIAAATTALKPGGLFIFDINRDQKRESHNNIIGGRNHSADDIAAVARDCGLIVRYPKRVDRIFFRCSKGVASAAK